MRVRTNRVFEVRRLAKITYPVKDVRKKESEKIVQRMQNMLGISYSWIQEGGMLDTDPGNGTS